MGGGRPTPNLNCYCSLYGCNIDLKLSSVTKNRLPQKVLLSYSKDNYEYSEYLHFSIIAVSIFCRCDLAILENDV